MRRFTGLAAGVVLGMSSVAWAGPSNQSAVANRALGTMLPEVKFQGSTLKDCFDFLRDVSGANIHVNWRALEAAGVTGDTQVTVRLREVPLRKVLNVLLSESGAGGTLTYYSSEGVIEITTSELADKEMITRVYPIEDLVMEIPDFAPSGGFSLTEGGSGGGGKGSKGGGGKGGGSGSGNSLFGDKSGAAGGEKTLTKTERAEALVKMISETIRPEVWRDAGGPASIRYYGGHIVVTAPRSVHEALGGTFE